MSGQEPPAAQQRSVSRKGRLFRHFRIDQLQRIGIDGFEPLAATVAFEQVEPHSPGELRVESCSSHEVIVEFLQMGLADRAIDSARGRHVVMGVEMHGERGGQEYGRRVERNRFRRLIPLLGTKVVRQPAQFACRAILPTGVSSCSI